MDQFNTPWRVTAAAIYTTPTDSRVYGTLDIDVTEARRFQERKRAEGIKITMTHLATAVLARAVAFDVPTRAELTIDDSRGRPHLSGSVTLAEVDVLALGGDRRAGGGPATG